MKLKERRLLMAYKTDRLKTRIIEKFGSQKEFAETLGMSEPTLSRLLNEGGEWKGSMLMKAVELLEIPAVQVESYFFESEVSKRKPEGVKT